MANDYEFEKMRDALASFIKYAQINLPDDVLTKLKELQEGEDNPLALEIYDIMFRNLELAKEMGRPICQDTGYMQFLIKCGSDFPLLGSLKSLVKEALAKATEETPLRFNVVETFSEKNTGTNMGAGAPTIWWEIVEDSEDCEIYVYPAGGGCSLPGQATMLMPSQGYGAAEEFVIDRVISMGPNACPPLFVGVGIGNSIETASMNAKHAILKPLNARNENEDAAKMEERIEKALNEANIGPQGLGGRFGVTGVNVVNSSRHPACIGVAVILGCWVHRRGLIRFDSELNYMSETHSGFNA